MQCQAKLLYLKDDMEKINAVSHGPQDEKCFCLWPNQLYALVIL